MKNRKIREQIGFYIGQTKIDIGKFKAQYVIACSLLVLVGIMISMVNQNMMQLSVAIVSLGSVGILYVLHTRATKSKSTLARVSE